MNSVPTAHLSRQRHKPAIEPSFADVFDPTAEADESLFWAFEGDQMETVAFVCNESGMRYACRSKGCQYKLIESVDGKPELYQITRDGKHEAWVQRQHQDSLDDMNRWALTAMDTADMMTYQYCDARR